MAVLIALLLLLAGLGVLILGAEFLVRGASSLAKKMRISPLVIGLTVVAFGTSMPELTVNLFSAVKGTADIAIGNIVGSNIANVLLILGLSAAIRPLTVQRSTAWKEIPFALLGMALVLTMGNDAFLDRSSFNAITRTDGFSLISLFIIFMYYIFGLAKQEGNHAPEVKIYRNSISLLFIVFGLAGLFMGGKVLVEQAVVLARIAGLSEAFIGLTIVAVGTSLPELVTSVVAVLHRQDEIAVGNIVGSNIFNVFWILGLTSTLLQLPFNPDVNVDVLVGVGATFLLFLSLFFGKKHRLERGQGVFFVLLYVGYLVYLVQRG